MFTLLLSLVLVMQSDNLPPTHQIEFISTCQVYIKGSKENWKFDEVFIHVDEEYVYVDTKCFVVSSTKSFNETIEVNVEDREGKRHTFLIRKDCIMYFINQDPSDRVVYKPKCYSS